MYELIKLCFKIYSAIKYINWCIYVVYYAIMHVCIHLFCIMILWNLKCWACIICDQKYTLVCVCMQVWMLIFFRWSLNLCFLIINFLRSHSSWTIHVYSFIWSVCFKNKISLWNLQLATRISLREERLKSVINFARIKWK